MPTIERMTGQSDTYTMSSDPFADPVAPQPTERELITEATLAVGENASLTLTKDSLIVLDDYVRETPRYCGLIPQKSIATRTIPFFNILSADLTKSSITIRYARPVSAKKANSDVSVHTIHYKLNSSHDLAAKWAAHLLSRAYGPSQRQKRIKVLINPFGGTGKAGKIYNKYIAPIFEAAASIVDVEQTRYQGHATEIARQMDVEQYDVLACASGDGLPFEAFNGLAKKSNAAEALRKVAVVQLPCGTGNAMSWNLNGTASPSLAALTIIKGVRTPMDLVSITQGDTRTVSFLSQSIGIIAESDLGTDNIRWMGDFRFTYGFLVRLLGQTTYPVDISVKTEIEDKSELKAYYAREMAKRRNVDNTARSEDILDQSLESATALGLPPLKYGTINDPLPDDWEPMQPYLNLGNFYCGNMCYMAADTPFFPVSLPNDGLLDFVTIDGDISRVAAVSLLLAVENNTFLDNPLVRYRKISGLRVEPRFGWAGAHDKSKTPSKETSGLLSKVMGRVIGSQSDKEGFFSVDGEKLPFGPFQIEVHRSLGTVLSRRWGCYEFEEGPKGWDTAASPAKDAEDEAIRHHQERQL